MRNQSGQTLLIVVLVMVVALTVGLSVASRSITNLRTTTEEENSQRAFSAAEAGVERALKTLCTTAECTIAGKFEENKAEFNTITNKVEGTEFLVNNGNPVFKDDGADIWLINHNSDDSLNFSSGWQALTGDAKVTIYWGTSSDRCTEAAIEIIAITGFPNNPVIKRYAIDPCSGRRTNNNFSADDTAERSGGSAKGKNFAYRTTIDIKNTSKGILLRTIPLYANTPIGVKGCNFNIDATSPSCNAFPAQGKVIESTGQSGGTARKVTLFQGYPKLPSEFFQYIIFSP